MYHAHTEILGKPTLVLFDALALLIVPQFQPVVQCASQDEPAIGREPHKRYWWVCLIYEGFEALPAIAVPYSAQPIVAAGDDQGAISVEVHSCHRIRVCRKDLQISFVNPLLALIGRSD